jgi:hypothetical protein
MIEAAWKDLGLADLMRKGPGQKSGSASGGEMAGNKSLPR